MLDWLDSAHYPTNPTLIACNVRLDVLWEMNRFKMALDKVSDSEDHALIVRYDFSVHIYMYILLLILFLGDVNDLMLWFTGIGYKSN